jgi:hypothetical protein
LTVSQDMHYLPIQVDLEAGQVHGLPPRWQDLSAVVVGLVTENPEDFGVDPEIGQTMRASTRPHRRTVTAGRDESDEYLTTSVAGPDIAVSVQEKHALLDGFAASVTSAVFVSANGLTESSAATMKAFAVPLLKRGFNVDLMWSAQAAEEDAVRRTLQQARGEGGAGKLTLLHNGHEVAADLVLGTTLSGPMALIGTGLFIQANRGIVTRLAGYRALTSLARLCAGWWEDIAADDTAIPVFRWRHTAEQWASQCARESDANAPIAGPTREASDIGMVALITTHHLPTPVRADSPTPQWFLDIDDRLVVANAGNEAMHFVFTGPIRPELMARLRPA